MHTDSSAIATCLRLRSTVECTATVRMPRARHARRMRSAISPRLAITTLSSMGFGIRDLGFWKGIRLADTAFVRADQGVEAGEGAIRSEAQTPEPQSLMRISYAVVCLQKKKTQ